MEKAKIGGAQLFSLMMLFELGSALLVGLGMKAKQDAWLAILLGWAGGLVLFFIYSSLFRLYPDLPLTAYLQKIIGKYPGWILGLIYTLYFIYLASRVMRDFGELLVTSSYDQTPLFIINMLMMLTIAYVLHKGFEVFSRTAEIYLKVLLALVAFGYLAVLISGITHANNLLPILKEGWKPVLKTAFPLTLTFPFGEMISFTMLLPYLNRPKKVMKIGFLALTASAFILSCTSLLNIAVLGADIAGRSTFPLLTMIGKVNIGEFIQRLDVLAILTLIIGGFFKIGVFFYTAVIGAAQLFKIEQHGKLIFSIGMIVLLTSLQIASNMPEHLEEGLKVVPMYLHLPLQVGIPLLLIIVALIRRKREKEKMSS
ncbi:GerAB/ArcD/ProY family transporter [Brevibacillus ginsengisoli]|uniref:GerAB/ArcD/ProY family transporter n=1 Tax=Brevibacillus ginsengisoli TaxID=363854 RepID=UPI003CF2CC2A